jgi:hypothetical protein
VSSTDHSDPHCATSHSTYKKAKCDARNLVILILLCGAPQIHNFYI